MTLPTFVVIGAMKAGTVSLRHYLDEHPDVFLGRGGRFGEPNFFVAEYNWPRGRDWYESLFDGAGGAAAIGECSPCYTWAHAFRGVPERMAQVVPEARLVYVVRDPIARMQSMYMHQVSPAGSDAARRWPCSTTVTSGRACTGSSSRRFSITSTAARYS